MRRLFAIVLLALFSLSIATVSAAPTEDLNALARYYPEDTWGYAGVRTDDDFITTLDGILQTAIAYAPQGALPPLNLNDVLDMGVAQLGSTSFADDVRPWLGDVASIGLWTSPTDNAFTDPAILIAAQITDADAAKAFVTAAVEAQSGNAATFKAVGNYEVLASSDATFFVVDANTLFITTDARIITEGIPSSLADSADFDNVFALLPGDDYNVTVYVNALAINEFNLNTMGGELPTFFTDVLNISQSQALGATILDGDTFVIDAAVSIDVEALEQFGISYDYDITAVDLDFANRVPADAPLVILGTNTGNAVLTQLNAIRNLSNYINEQGGIGTLLAEADLLFGDEEIMLANSLDLSLVLGLVNFPFAGFTGLSLERDVLSVINGDSAVFLRARPVDDFFIPVLPDFGIIYETEDVDGALNIVDTLTESMTAYDLAIETESYADGRALVFPTDLVNINYSNLDLMVAAGDGVLSIGSRPAVEGALDTATGLADSPSFQAASQYFLDDAYQILYATGDPVYEIVDFLIETSLLPTTEEVGIGYRLGSIVDSASISVNSSEDGSQGVSRLVLSLSDEPREFPALD